MADDIDNDAGPTGRPNTTTAQPDGFRRQTTKQSSNARKHNPGQARPNRPTLNTSLPQNTPSAVRPRRPQYSLAGGHSQAVHNQSYVDPTYYEYNPSYRNPKAAPVWGLAKPLPRVVRPGMRRGERETRHGDGVVENKDAEINAPGSAEAIPQLGMIEEQREEEGKLPVGGQSKNQDQRGYGHQNKRNKQASTRNIPNAGHEGYNSRLMNSRGTPQDERSDPMDDWSPPKSSPVPIPLDDEKGDLGERRLARPSTFHNTTSGASLMDHRKDTDLDDLESGRSSDNLTRETEDNEEYIEDEDDMHNTWASIRARFREPLAEFLATMVAVLIGLSTNLSVQLSHDTKGTYFSANWAWGLGITIGIYIAGGISGGHLNPAISLMLCIYRGFPLRKAGIYITAQLIGALIAGLLAFAIYKDAILDFDASGGIIGVEGGSRSPVDYYTGGTGVSFYTQPADLLGPGAAFANDFLATAILACAILALGDDSNAPPGAGMHAFIVGLLVTALTMAFGYNTGACLNPARDFGPRLATVLVGYGSGPFTARDAWWVYGAWGATISGALAGGGIYDIAIFVGGESPINYPRGKRRKIARKVRKDTKNRWWHLRRFRDRHLKKKQEKIVD